ncbi:lysophospholipase [Algimonas ampicilliniresistens]|uniref:Lysophospholipase n=2 Tax=Algimonas ampicilliniresistens TaxID=1298735 RepID=A0ABQ5VAE0_9PROT|nr:lysophospholipase [Algimonas ampicilliniresistens]
MFPMLDFDRADLVQPGGHSVPDGLGPRLSLYFLDRPAGDHGPAQRLRVMLATNGTDGEPRGTIFFSPGRTEFIEKYLETVDSLTQRGFWVVIMDPRGQGLSGRILEDRLRSYVETFQDYADDLGWICDTLAPHCPKPFIAMGHSMGGTIVLHAVLSATLSPSAVICSAPMLGLVDVDNGLMRSGIRALSALGLSKSNLPFQKQRGGLPVAFADNKLTSDRDRYRRWASFFQDTPRLRVGEPTFGWIAAALNSMAFINRNAPQLGIPGLMVAAGGDQIVDPASIEQFAMKSGCDFHVVPGAKHELFLERDVMRNEFLGVIDRFLEEQAL